MPEPIREGPLLYRRDDHIGVITINRPEVHNAISLEIIARLGELVDAIREDAAVRVVILTGAGDRSFVAGGDVKEFQELTTIDAARRMSATMKDVIDRLVSLPVPVIAAINGYALGGGCELAVACDLRIAADTAKLGYRHVKLGLISGWGGGPRLLRLLPRAQALELMLTGRTLTAQEAASIGLVNRVVPQPDLMTETMKLAREIAAHPPLAVRGIKRLACYNDHHPLEAAIEFETELFGPIWMSEDHNEAVDAMMEKREPQFKGR